MARSAIQPALSVLVPEAKRTEREEGLPEEGLTQGLRVEQAHPLGDGMLQKPEASLFHKRRPSDYQVNGAPNGNCSY